ncbi:hypothetical protein L6R21_23525, partial [bacterium]|nr:hypothetical protein [bacterium]
LGNTYYEATTPFQKTFGNNIYEPMRCSGGANKNLASLDLLPYIQPSSANFRNYHKPVTHTQRT